MVDSTPLKKEKRYTGQTDQRSPTKVVKDDLESLASKRERRYALVSEIFSDSLAEAPPLPMSILSWNCRGLGNPRSVRDLHLLVKEKRPNLLFLMEQK